MVTSTSLKDELRARVRTIKELTADLTAGRASASPAEGEWCVNEVLSHLAGPETQSFYDGIRLFVDQDLPELSVTPGETYVGDSREGESLRELRRNVIEQYTQIAEFVGGLSDEQLERKAHIPGMKETPLGDSPTLGVWIGAIVNYHLPGHIEQLQALCKE